MISAWPRPKRAPQTQPKICAAQGASDDPRLVWRPRGAGICHGGLPKISSLWVAPVPFFLSWCPSYFLVGFKEGNQKEPAPSFLCFFEWGGLLFNKHRNTHTHTLKDWLLLEGLSFDWPLGTSKLANPKTSKRMSSRCSSNGLFLFWVVQNECQTVGVCKLLWCPTANC